MNSMGMSLQKLSALLVIPSVIGLGSLSVVNAQNVNSQSQAVESQPMQKELIEPNLEPFAGAYKEISQIHTTYKERIIQAEDPTKSEALQEEANQKMSQAVSDHGLTITDYNTIFESIQKDPALKEAFMTVLNRTQ
ncbi:DUF4168 domain-containing protein [uncultured Nitrospira sp.]|uniref:DUF4168 domain-containing protein n=1 Tax=uncultured Nitrospira sp. TaxID=157176 RepID=UPI00314024C7